MTEEDRIDFSALDPARDPARWEERVQKTASRAFARRAVLGGWSRVAIVGSALALAAGIVLLVRPKPDDRPGDRVLLGESPSVDLVLSIGARR
jgi:hypothetical protein